MSSSDVKLGVAVFVTDEGLRPDELATCVEQHGFESLFITEHTHIPASRESHYLPEGGELRREYSHTLDPFVALTAAATATSSLRLATGVCLLAQHDPITTAKQVASLDFVSEGRFILGVGAGWNREEMRNHGTDPHRRFSILREHVEAMRTIWTEDEASYHGEHVDFDRIWAWPKPVQRPGPPVLVGGDGPTVLDRVLTFGDGWLPEPADGLIDRMNELRREAAERGRPVSITIYGADLDSIEDYAAAGAERCVFWLPPAPGEATREAIRELAEMMAPHV